MPTPTRSANPRDQLAVLVSIVIVAKNEYHNLEISIPRILIQKCDQPFEVIVIDSGSTDGAVELVREWSEADARVKLVEIPSGTFHHARSRNMGAQIARGRYLVFLGGDAVPLDRNWLQELLQPLHMESDVAAVYGRQIPKANVDTNNHCRISYVYGREFLIRDRNSPGGAKQKYSFSTVSCAIDRERVASPLFRADLPVSEDLGLAFQVIRSGAKLAYNPKSVVIHSHNYGYVEILRRYFDNMYSCHCIGILGTDGGGFIGEGMRYLSHARRTLSRVGLAPQLRFVAFMGFATLGVLLGKLAPILPYAIVRRVSKYRT